MASTSRPLSRGHTLSIFVRVRLKVILDQIIKIDIEDLHDVEQATQAEAWSVPLHMRRWQPVSVPSFSASCFLRHVLLNAKKFQVFVYDAMSKK